ncbi:uncharacterized protein LOC107647664 [Arachis ipaensis]|uniref:uncharacterized protein LOC107647664 n=1 Tax=Arachis ipaensis TaxID=130454 RepID=UPI0007AF63B1|nr:uncharacterized protein LOC107647664 [Arachis ipaensis]
MEVVGSAMFTTMSQHLEEKVVIAGDFNAITSQAEKEGGGQKSATTIATFTNFIDSNELVDIGMVGHPFTWTNRRQGEDLVKERLDHYLVGMEWKMKFPNAVVHRLTESGSDHAPILMETEPQSWHSKRRFKYQERWCGEEDVKRIVSEKTHKANSRKEIEDLQAKLEELRVAGINGGEEVTSLEEKLELDAKEQNLEISGRDNEIASKPEDIAKVAEEYFCDIFTSSCSADPNPYLEDLESKVTASMNRRLQRPVTMDEVKRATFSVHAQGAPGDDGFTAKFFHFFWDIVGGDVFKAVRSFFHSGRILKSFNHTQICLIPKVPDASDMTQSAPNTSQSILELLETYEGFSGQKVNLNKSAIFFSHNTPQNTRLAVAQTLNIEHIGAQDKYLGLPSIVQKSKKATFGAIKDKVQKRIMDWKRSILSLGGRHTLLRAVGEAIPIYTLSCFKLPDTLLTEIHSMLSQFWWGQKGAERSMVWIKWDTMTRPKKDGGLGGIYEVGSGYKIAYGFFHSPTSLRSQNIHNRVWNSIWELKLPHKIKIFLWKSLHEKLPVLQQVHSWFASTPATCPRCMLKAESISHALFQCPLSSIIWSLNLITPDLWMREEETFFNWWQRVLSWAAAQFDGRQKTLLIAALCWSTWKARNRCVFEKVISPAPEIVKEASNLVRELVNHT